MKRFTETEKWRDSWFQGLSPDAKLVFIYMTENCDAAGVWDPNHKLAEFAIGKKFNWEKIEEELNSKFVRLENGKLFLFRFVDFQYGQLTDACKPHQKVLRVLQSHGITYPIQKGINTLKDKEEEEDMDNKGGVGETTAHTRSSVFTPPTPEDVTIYSESIGYPLDGAAWCDTYTQKGWTVGKNRMKDWRAAVRTWKANKYTLGQKTEGRGAQRTMSWNQ